MHAEYSIGIVDAGHTIFHHARGPESVGPGGVVLIEPGAWHACNPGQAAPWSYRMLFIDAAWLHQRLGVQALRFPRRTLAHAAATDAADRLCQPVDSPATAERLAMAIEQWLRGVAEAQPSAPDSGNTALAPALQRLHAGSCANLSADLSVQALAHACGMSASRFIRCFKAATGLTPGAYRLNLRLNGARRLLAEGSALSEAAYAMGFADQAHLQRAFKAHHSMTPGCYARGA